MTGAFLINIGELAQPATTLIEKISDAIGVVFEPKKIVRKAKADAEASIIQATAQLEISEIEERGLQRLIHQETRKQKNIEAITAKAIHELPEDAEVDNLDVDWLVCFFDKCDKVSDEQMQDIWARVLAGEANKSNSFSKRTMNTIALLSKEDAEMFTNFGQFVWNMGKSTPIIFSWKNEIYGKEFINIYEILIHLVSLGVVSLGNNSNLEVIMSPQQTGDSEPILISYFDQNFEAKFKEMNVQKFTVGTCLFTAIGMELFKICGAKPNQEFCNYVIEEFEKQGIEVTEVK